MKLWDILKTVGSVALQVALPGAGSAIVAAVNAFLPDDSKLPAAATGNEINDAIAKLPPEQQAAVLEKQFDVSITEIRESNSTIRAMLESDAKNPQTTRPYIAKGSFLVVAFVSILSMSMWSYGVLSGNASLVSVVMGGWQFILALIAPLVTLLWAYFGVLKKEHKDRLDAANGNTTLSGISGILTSILNRR